MLLEWRRLEKFIFETLNIKWTHRFEKCEIEIDYIYMSIILGQWPCQNRFYSCIIWKLKWYEVRKLLLTKMLMLFGFSSYISNQKPER